VKLSLRQLLVIPFVLQIAIFVGITGFFSYRNGQKAVNDLANQLHEEISSRIELDLRTHLNTAHIMNETNRNAVTQEFISLKDFTSLKRFFLGQLHAFHTIDYVAWGSEQGEYIGIKRLKNQQFNLEIVQTSTQDWFHIYRLTETGERGKLLEKLPNYDPRRRPWYQAATKSKTAIWTPIYFWFLQETLAMDAVLPVYDSEERLLGVLDTPLSLSEISDFLRDVKIGKSGQSFIMERSGMLVASSSASNPFIIKGDKLERVKAVDSYNILIRETAKNLQNKITNFESIQESISLDFKWDQQRYIVKIVPFSDPRGIDWLFCIVVPERDFMDLIIHNTRVTFFLCIIALIIATILGIITARRITAPLIQLSQASQAIAKGELDQNIELNREDEIGILPKSFNQIAMRLNRAFEELEIRVEARTNELKEAKVAIKNYNKQLEERVYQRTAELSLAIEDLQKTQTELLKQEEKLKFDAFHDSLTGLPNRAYLLNKIQDLIEFNQKEKNYLYAVLFLDLDRFKVINDSLGHLVGDELLKSVAHRLKSEIKPQDTVARLGGDEFIILLENIQDEGEVTDTAQRIIEQLKRPFYISQKQIFTGVSIGITLSSMGYSQAESMIRDADIAMYNAKHLGKGCYQVLTYAMQIPALQRLEQENQLRQALVRQEFILNYQPIISLITGKLTGFEVLIRWNHPVKKIISPCDFIQIAEETGLIQIIDLWVFKQACYQINNWNQQFPNLPPLTMNINLSPVDLKQTNLVENLQEIIDDNPLKNWKLKLEITETCFLETLTFEKKLMYQLRAIGIELCIDDFGTGYSSLSRLHNFPLCTLKIDRSFVREIQPKTKGAEIIHTIIMLAHSLGMDVVAEGIETKIQLEKLTELGCNYGQGYLISKPLDHFQATEFLISQVG